MMRTGTGQQEGKYQPNKIQQRGAPIKGDDSSGQNQNRAAKKKKRSNNRRRKKLAEEESNKCPY
jgi:hypothetical protein